jgi:TfoX/Sxy family transcriptional regulator of competence genes
MAYDTELAERMREELDGVAGVTEMTMFGGLAFLVGGNMAIAASGEGGAMVRVDPAESDRLVDTTTAELVVMRGRPMTGWLRVATDDLGTPEQLATWVRRGADYAGSLPPKAQ